MVVRFVYSVRRLSVQEYGGSSKGECAELLSSLNASMIDLKLTGWPAFNSYSFSR